MFGLALNLSAAVSPPQEQNQHSSVTHQKEFKTRNAWHCLALTHSSDSFPLEATKMHSYTVPPSYRQPSFCLNSIIESPGSTLSATAFPWEKPVEKDKVTCLLKTVRAARVKCTPTRQDSHAAHPLTSDSRLKTESNLATHSTAPVTVTPTSMQDGGGCCMESRFKISQL